MVDEFYRDPVTGFCTDQEDNVVWLKQMGYWDLTPGVQNVILFLDFGLGFDGCTDAVAETDPDFDSAIFVAMNRMDNGWQHAELLLAHELAHAHGYGGGHCGDPGFEPCSAGPENSLMAGSAADVGPVLSAAECTRMRP
jgi:hypothetical protein